MALNKTYHFKVTNDLCHDFMCNEVDLSIVMISGKCREYWHSVNF